MRWPEDIVLVEHLAQLEPMVVDTGLVTEADMAVLQVGLIAVKPVLVSGAVLIAQLVGLDAEEEEEEAAWPTLATARVHTFRRPHTSMSDVEVISM